MKKIIILVLLVALGVVAYTTKPTHPDKSLSHYLKDHENMNDIGVGRTLSKVTFEDRILWIDAKYGDKTVFTNLYHHWFNRAEVKEMLEKDLEAAKKDVEKAKDAVSGK